MKAHFWQYLIDTKGKPIKNANIYVYLAKTEIPAWYYDGEAGNRSYQSFNTKDKSGTVKVIKTNSNGYFEFWIGDATEVNGYSASQKFRIVWHKAGVSKGELDNVEIATGPVEVDETNTNTIKNRTVSNYLAKKWTDHANEGWLGRPHGIEEVDEIDDDSTKNCLVSNYLANKWEEHRSMEIMDDPHGLLSIIEELEGEIDRLSGEIEKLKDEIT